MSIEILVLADDFTGALDTGIQFAKFGARTKVTADPDCDFCKSGDTRILVIDTETRHQTKEEAGKILRNIVRRAVSAGVRLLYKKTDSALRGNVGAEMEALLTASQGERIHFIPAFPEMKRTVEDGILYIDGVPVAESVFGRDPFDPVTRSGIAEILGLQTEVPVTVTDRILTETEGIIVYNTRTTEEITDLVSRLNRFDRITLMAGCAGLAACLGTELTGNRQSPLPAEMTDYRGLLVVCGSVNAVTREQLEQAGKAGFFCMRLNNRQKLTGWIRTEEGKAALIAWQQQIRGKKNVLIDTNDLPEEESATEWGRAAGLNVLQVGDRIADTLAVLVCGFLENGVPQLLLLTGGDVLFHAMREMGVRELIPLAEVQPGVILAEFRYKEKNYRVLTKSGGFGTEDVMVRLAEQISQRGVKELL